MQRGRLRKKKIVASYTGNPDPQVARERVKACFSYFAIVITERLALPKTWMLPMGKIEVLVAATNNQSHSQLRLIPSPLTWLSPYQEQRTWQRFPPGAFRFRLLRPWLVPIFQSSFPTDRVDR